MRGVAGAGGVRMAGAESAAWGRAMASGRVPDTSNCAVAQSHGHRNCHRRHRSLSALPFSCRPDLPPNRARHCPPSLPRSARAFCHRQSSRIPRSTPDFWFTSSSTLTLAENMVAPPNRFNLSILSASVPKPRGKSSPPIGTDDHRPTDFYAALPNLAWRRRRLVRPAGPFRRE